MNIRSAGYTSLLCIVLTACSEGTSKTERSPTPETLLVDGSSTVYPLSKEAARRFERRAPKAHIKVDFSGTTAGFREFCRGQTDINNASRVINDKEQQACESNDIRYLELHIAMDSIAIVVNPKNTWAEGISVEELKKTWAPGAEGEIESWSDISGDWPDHPVELFGRGQDSGTYDYFTNAIVGSPRSSRSDYTASEDEEFLANRIAEEKNALGFFGVGAYHRNWSRLKLLSVDGVYPSLETVKDQSYTPLTRPLYLYVNKDRIATKATLAPFLDAYLEGLNRWIHFTGFMPVDQSILNENLASVKELVDQEVAGNAPASE